MNHLLLAASLIVFSILAGCTEKDITEPEIKPDPTIPFSTFSSIQKKVFTPICDQPGCHGSTNNQADLFLAEGEAFASLVDVQSLLFPGMTRVIPDSSSKSLIIKILKGEVSPRMPLSGPFLNDEVIDSIAHWIDNGALNN
jgi:hypothetical protein